MTTNSQNLTFGEWLAAGGISPNFYDGLSSLAQQVLRDEWQAGIVPYRGMTW